MHARRCLIILTFLSVTRFSRVFLQTCSDPDQMLHCETKSFLPSYLKKTKLCLMCVREKKCLRLWYLQGMSVSLNPTTWNVLLAFFQIFTVHFSEFLVEKVVSTLVKFIFHYKGTQSWNGLRKFWRISLLSIHHSVLLCQNGSSSNLGDESKVSDIISLSIYNSLDFC